MPRVKDEKTQTTSHRVETTGGTLLWKHDDEATATAEAARANGDATSLGIRTRYVVKAV